MPAGDLKDIKLKVFRFDDNIDPEFVRYDFDAVYANDIEIVSELTEEQKKIERFDVAMEEARRKQERAEMTNRLKEENEERKRMIRESEQE